MTNWLITIVVYAGLVGLLHIMITRPDIFMALLMTVGSIAIFFSIKIAVDEAMKRFDK